MGYLTEAETSAAIERHAWGHIRALDVAAEKAQEELIAAIRELLPVGAYIEIPRGNGFIRGRISRPVGYCSDPWRVALTLESTGKEYWCSAWAWFDERGATRFSKPAALQREEPRG